MNINDARELAQHLEVLANKLKHAAERWESDPDTVCYQMQQILDEVSDYALRAGEELTEDGV